MLAQADASIIRTDRDFMMGTWKNVFVLVWYDMNERGAEVVDAEFRRFAAVRPRGFGILTIVDEDAPMPGSRARSMVSNTLSRLGEAVVGLAVSQEGAGFRGAAVRSVAVGLSLLARPPYPFKIFADVPAAAGWLSAELARKQLGHDDDARELTAFTMRLRAERPGS